ncbi:MAG: 23S rRNA (adenine(2503)-C(2))-methyltransferase RlmN [Oligoflexus sp.]
MQMFEFTRQELEERCKEIQVAPVHAKDLMRETYKELAREPWLRRGLPMRLQREFADQARTDSARIREERCSRYDSTVKFLVALTDDALVESVLMPEKSRITLCISSQVGCAQACSFCHTGRMGLKRQMTAGEIVGQVVMANRWLKEHPEWGKAWNYPDDCRVTNIVFMGMGEPLDNVEELKKALKILTDPYGLNIGLRRISVSTAGHLPGIKNLLLDFPQVSLALSLHATTDRERSRLMPINRRWPIQEVLDYLRGHYEALQGKRDLLIQYTVIQGVNDTPRHAEELLQLLNGLPVKVNLIPLNDVEQIRFRAPQPESLANFRDLLHQGGIRVMIRYSKGQDIEAACGQLAVQEA